MSIDTIAPPSDGPQPDDQPPKKKSKKQKKAEAAAKRAAAAAAAKAEEEAAASAEASTVDGEPVEESTTEPPTPSESAPTAEVPASEVPTSEPVSTEAPAVEATTEQKKKDGKHGRDEDDEDDDGLVITEAKKVKADTGEVVKLESVDVGMEDLKPEVAVPAPVEPLETPTTEPATPAVEPPTPSGVSSLPPKPVTIPTGPAADSRPPVAPTNRENSRLRIYFSSPVVAASTYSIHHQDADKKTPAPTKESTVEPVAPVKTEESTSEEKPAAAANEEGAAVTDDTASVQGQGASDLDLEGEDLDGVDVDGEPVDGEPVATTEAAPVVEEEHTAEDSDDDDQAIQSSLLAAKSESGVDGEEVVKVEGVDATNPESVDSAAPTLAVDNASYPPDPYSQGAQTDNVVAPSVTDEVTTVPEIPPILPPEPSADRISISYARNTRRMVLDAEVVDKVKIFRSEARIELTVLLRPATIGAGEEQVLDEFRVCQGVLVR